MKYISYGLTEQEFDDKRVKVRNRLNLKPAGGLWACPLEYKGRTWKDFCIEEDFSISSLKKSFTFSLKNNSKIFYIHTVSDFQYLINKYGNKIRLNHLNVWDATIDFTEMARDYDGIYFYAPKNEGFGSGFYSDIFHGAAAIDVESVCIFKPGIIVK